MDTSLTLLQETLFAINLHAYPKSPSQSHSAPNCSARPPMAAFAIAGPSLPWFPTAPLASPLASPPASSAPRPATSSTGGAAAVSAGAAAVSAVSAARRSRVTRRAEAKVATEEEEDVYYRSAAGQKVIGDYTWTLQGVSNGLPHTTYRLPLGTPWRVLV